MPFSKSWIIGCLIACVLAFLTLLGGALSWSYPEVLPAGWNIQLLLDRAGTKSFLNALSSGLLISGSTALLSCLFAFGSAYYIRQPGYQLIGYLPFALPPVLVGVLISRQWLYWSLFGTAHGVVLAQCMLAYPYAYILMRGFWNLPMLNYLQLARSLGSSRYYLFTAVVMPMAATSLISVLFQTFLLSWFEFGLTNFIAGGRIETPVLLVYQYFQGSNHFLAASAGLVTVSVPMAVLFVVLIIRFFISRASIS